MAWRVVVGRVFNVAVTLLGVMLIMFLARNILPADPAQVILGEGISSEAYAAQRAQLGLDQPLPVQLRIYLTAVLHGDFGTSIRYHESSLSLVLASLGNTLLLVIPSITLAFVIGTAIGLIAAVKRGTVLDHLLIGTSLLGEAMPSYYLAILLVFIFAVSLHVLPAGGRGEPPDLAHMLLPVLALTMNYVTTTGRIVRSSLIDVLERDYIAFARARHLRASIVYRYALRDSLIAVIANLASQFTGKLGGTVVVLETVFAWPGVGRLTYIALTQNDFPLASAAIFTLTLIAVGVTLCADVLYNLVDPRIGMKKGSGYAIQAISGP